MTGRKVDVVSRLLNVLSYFVRCSEVHENVHGSGPFSREAHSEVHENVHGSGPFSREAHSCSSTSEGLEEDHFFDSDNVPGAPVSGQPNDGDGPSQSNCDGGKCIFETTPLEGMVSSGSVVNATIGELDCDVGSSNSEPKSSTVWYVDLPCEATEADTEETAIVEKHDSQCRRDTVQQSRVGHCECVIRESDRPLSVRVMTSKTACESSANVHSPVLQNANVSAMVSSDSCMQCVYDGISIGIHIDDSSENRCQERHHELTPPSGFHCNQKRAVLHCVSDGKSKQNECHKLTAGGHVSSDRRVAVDCGRDIDSYIENTIEDHVPQSLFLFRRFDQCQDICAPIAGKDEAVDAASDSGCALSSSRRQRSVVCGRDSELQPANSDDSSSREAATSVQVYNAGDMQSSSTSVNDTGELDNERCQLSPSYIREETKVLRVRLVGRMAPSEISQTHTDIAPELCDIATRSCHDHKVRQDYLGGTAGNRLSCHQGCGDAGDRCHTKDCERLQQVSVEQMFHDSGVFDVPSSEVETDATRTEQRDSGICITDLYSSNSVKTECSETIETNTGAKDLCNTPTVPNHFSFSRSNSMFDEYFKDDVADGAASIPTEGVVDDFSADAFSEYLDAPMPDLSELRKYSAAHQTAALSAKHEYTHLLSMEESPSMFDEYFTDETNVVSSRQSKCETTQEASVLESTETQRQQLRRQSEPTRNIAESAARNTATGRSVRRKHRSDETVARKNSLQHCCNVLLGRQINSPAPSGAATRWVHNYAFIFNIQLHIQYTTSTTHALYSSLGVFHVNIPFII